MSETLQEKSQWIVAAAVQSISQAPFYHLMIEAGLLLWIVYLIFFKSYKSKDKVSVSKKEMEELIKEWEPQPLVPPLDKSLKEQIKYRAVTGPARKMITIDGKECLNFASTNFLDLLGNERIQTKVEACIRKYGVGSCGPRGFYGTIDVHLNLETRLAEIMECEKAITYSYGFATIASAIPAYAKRGDILFVDEGVNFSVQKGVSASRSHVIVYKHNDMEDLEQKLIEQQRKDKKDPKRAAVTRKFMITEGVFANTGLLCNLPRLVELKYKYKVRLFVEESFSWGVLGEKGRGVTEHFKVPISKVDMICANLENSIASIGGFACGSKYVISHQELSGQGYVFSASLPPLVSQASIEALEITQENPAIFEELRKKAATFHQMLSSNEEIVTSGYIESAIFHIRRKHASDDQQLETETLRLIVDECAELGVCLTVANRLEKLELQQSWPPSIRISVSVAMDDGDMKQAAQVISQAFAAHND